MPRRGFTSRRCRGTDSNTGGFMKTQHLPRPSQRTNNVVFGTLLALFPTTAANSTPTNASVPGVERASDHPIVAIAITLFVLSTILLGLMHQCEIGGEILIL